jgi:hypothetical protein
MAASILRSERATNVMHLVVDVFVRARRTEMALAATKAQALAVASPFSNRVQKTIDRVLDAVVDQHNQRTIRDEATVVFQRAIEHIKSRLNKAEFENARAAALLSEAEVNKAGAAKTLAEAEAISLRNIANKLKLVLEAEQAMARGEMDGFLRVLGELGKH